MCNAEANLVYRAKGNEGMDCPARATGMQIFSKIVSSYSMFICTENVFGVLSKKQENVAPRSQTNDFPEATVPATEINKRQPEGVWQISGCRQGSKICDLAVPATR